MAEIALQNQAITQGTRSGNERPTEYNKTIYRRLPFDSLSLHYKQKITIVYELLLPALNLPLISLQAGLILASA